MTTVTGCLAATPGSIPATGKPAKNDEGLFAELMAALAGVAGLLAVPGPQAQTGTADSATAVTGKAVSGVAPDPYGLTGGGQGTDQGVAPPATGSETAADGILSPPPAKASGADPVPAILQGADGSATTSFSAGPLAGSPVSPPGAEVQTVWSPPGPGGSGQEDSGPVSGTAAPGGSPVPVTSQAAGTIQTVSGSVVPGTVRGGPSQTQGAPADPGMPQAGTVQGTLSPGTPQAAVATGVQVPSQAQASVATGVQVPSQAQASVATGVQVPSQAQASVATGVQVPSQAQASVATAVQVPYQATPQPEGSSSSPIQGAVIVPAASVSGANGPTDGEAFQSATDGGSTSSGGNNQADKTQVVNVTSPTPVYQTIPEGTTVPVANLPHAVAQTIEHYVSQGGRLPAQLELHLDPPALGPLTIHLALDGGALSVAFVAASPHAQTAVAASLPQMRALLGQLNVALGQAQVFLSSGGGGTAGHFRGGPPGRWTGPGRDGFPAGLNEAQIPVSPGTSLVNVLV